MRILTILFLYSLCFSGFVCAQTFSSEVAYPRSFTLNSLKLAPHGENSNELLCLPGSVKDNYGLGIKFKLNRKSDILMDWQNMYSAVYIETRRSDFGSLFSFRTSLVGATYCYDLLKDTTNEKKYGVDGLLGVRFRYVHSETRIIEEGDPTFGIPHHIGTQTDKNIAAHIGLGFSYLVKGRLILGLRTSYVYHITRQRIALRELYTGRENEGREIPVMKHMLILEPYIGFALIQ